MPNGKERPPVSELPLHLIEAFAQTFIHRQDSYPKQLETGKYVRIKEPLTLSLIYAHLRGEITLGTFALDSESIARWVCLDADELDQWHAIKGAAQKWEDLGLFPRLEVSSRGGHCWFFTPPLPGKVVRQFGKALLAKYGLGKMEVYPKQEVLSTGTGSLVRLPFGIHKKTGKRYFFITPSGEPLAPTIRQQIALLANPAIVPQTLIDHIIAEAEETMNAPPLPTHKKIFARVPQRNGETLSERIKNSISVFDFVSRYVALDQAGKGLCPFHDDHEKSFGVHRERNFWHCYAGCGGGSVIDFWSKWREAHGQDGSFTATIKELAALLF